MAESGEVKLKVTSDKDYIVISKPGKDIENTVTLNLKLEGGANAEAGGGRVRRVDVSFYPDLATREECEQIVLAYRKDGEDEVLDELAFGGGEPVLVKSIQIRDEKVPCSFFILLKKVVSHISEEGEGHIKVQVILTQGESLEQEVFFQRATEQESKILDFYPEHGSVLPGSQVGLNWNIQGSVEAGEVYLEGGGESYQVSEESGSMDVKISQTTRFTLRIKKGGVEKDEREIVVQTLPVYLKSFYVNESREKAILELCCASSLTVDGQDWGKPENNLPYEIEVQDKTMVMTASDGNISIIGALYCGRNPGEPENDISHFRKILTCRSGVWILNVEWKKMIFQRGSVKAARGLVLTLKDNKRNRKEVFYEAEDVEGNLHSWETLLENCSPETINQDIQVMMDVTSEEGTSYSITI